MALNIKTLDAKEAPRVFALVAGKAGIGKTTQATTFPRQETFIISVENGLLSIAGSGYACEEIKSYDRLVEILEKEITANPWIKHICIDSLSEIYDLINKEAKDKFTSKQNFAKFDYVKDRLFYAIRLAKQLTGVNVFFICHTKEDKNGLELEENLAFDGKMPEDIKKQFDLILHMTTHDDDQGKSHRVFLTNAETSKIAKARVSPWLNVKLNDMEEPNLYKLCLKMAGKGEK